MKHIVLLAGLLFLQAPVFSQHVISIDINLTQVKNGTCSVRVNLAKAEQGKDYRFPVAVPGTYEMTNYRQFNSHPIGIDMEGNALNIEESKNSFILPENGLRELMYHSAQSLNPRGMLYPENTYYSNSLYLLNWNVLAGYFNHTDNAYVIKVTRPAGLWGSTPMSKTILNDSVDVFKAASYSELIHSPVMYSKADTTSFSIDKSRFRIAVYSTSPRYTSLSLGRQLKPVLKQCLAGSEHAPSDYAILCIIGDAGMTDALVALEHPNATVICMPTLFKDSTVLSATVAHEFDHTLYTPLYIRSKKIKDFDYDKPESDQHLWFYEGCVEYLAQRQCLKAGVFDTAHFIRDLHACYLNMDNTNLLKTSKDIYTPKGQKHFMDFYTKGCLVGFLLDQELLQKSNGQLSLAGLMVKLQQYQKREGAFDEDHFFSLLLQLSGIGLTPFVDKYISSSNRIDFNAALAKIGYRIETVQEPDSVSYSFGVSSLKVSTNENNEAQLLLKKSDINKQLGMKKLFVTRINGEKISPAIFRTLFHPDSAHVELVIREGEVDRTVDVLARKVPFKHYKRVVTPLKSVHNAFARTYWAQ